MNEKPDNKTDEQEKEETDESLWEIDQKKRSYYYDDSTGYEIYNPDDDDDEDEQGNR